MTTMRQFFTKKPWIVEYMTLELSHPAFETLRYVANQFFDIEFNGQTYQPAAMSVIETTQDDSGSVSYTIQLGRVGSQTKAFVKAIDKFPLGWLTPVDATINYYLQTDMNAPYRPTIILTVASLEIDDDNVSISIDNANPRLIGVAGKYNTQNFPGTGAQI
jgi:hypothetical protein